MVLLDSTSLYTMHYVPDFLASDSIWTFSDQCTNVKSCDFWIGSKSPIETILNVFVAVVERLNALHYRVDLIFLSFGIMGFIVEL